MTRTPSQTVGPFYAIGLCRRDENALDPNGVELLGRLLDGQGEPIPDGIVEVWHAASRRWGRSPTDASGGFRFRVPRDAAHLEAYVFARGLLRHQLTRVYLEDRPDAVLEGVPPERRRTLAARREDDGYVFDIHLQGEQETVFFAV